LRGTLKYRETTFWDFYNKAGGALRPDFRRGSAPSLCIRKMSSNAEIAQRYCRMQLETASHPQIIWQIHAKCAQLVKQAQSHEGGQRRMMLILAQNLLAELEGSLKVTDELSKGLFYLYDYCYCLLDTPRNEDHDRALHLLSGIRDTLGTLLRKKT
jgi:flagellin-specific chaperone FliS